LKFKEKHELEKLPAQIEQLEAATAQLHQEMAAADFYQRPSAQIAAKQAELKQLEAELSVAFQRWEALEQLSS
jgi:ATP-binding cassette subfamily F protein uup